MSNTQQPKWRRIANLGDVNPVEYGGFFVYVDTTGVYPPEAELLQSPDSDDDGIGWTIYRFPLERCTFIDGVLSDNQFHPQHSAWFATPEAERANRPQDTCYLSNVAESADYPVEEIIADFCSPDPLKLANAYRAIGEYHGFENFDSYPQHYAKRSELPRRIRRYNGR